MNLTIGPIWGTIFGILTIFAAIFGITGIISLYEERMRIVFKGLITILIMSIIVGLGYLTTFAFTHYRVDINTRSLLFNKIEQEIIETRESGVQERPFIGAKSFDYPAHEMKTEFAMGGGVSSATALNGMGINNAVNVYLNTRSMDITQMYTEYNGDWDHFMAEFLRPQLMKIARGITKDYNPEELTTRRVDWEKEFDKQTTAFLEASGYDIYLIKNQTVMSWDFVSKDDEMAYEEAKRAGYLEEIALKQKAALVIQKQMATIRAEMLTESATGSVDAVQIMANYLGSVDPEMRPYLMEYLETQVDLEYLRLVAELKPDIIIPPGSQGTTIMIPAETNAPAAPINAPVTE